MTLQLHAARPFAVDTSLWERTRKPVAISFFGGVVAQTDELLVALAIAKSESALPSDC